MDKVNGHSPQEIARLVTRSGVAKARMSLDVYIIKSFLGGAFIALGGLADLVILSGSTGLRESNPTLASTIAGFIFPLGFVLIILTNQELATSNMFTMPFTTFQGKTTVWDWAKNWIITYVFNMAGCLFVAGFLAWWSDVLSLDVQKAYAVTQANGRVNQQWSVNFLRGVGCNLFVSLAFFLSLGSVEFVSKIYSIWIPVWAFVILGYQHSIANFFLIPIGMFYGTNFGVGKFIYQSIIPVTLGNIVGAMILGAVPFWYLYGRNEQGLDLATGQPLAVERASDRQAVLMEEGKAEEDSQRREEEDKQVKGSWLKRTYTRRGRSENFWHGGIGMVHDYPHMSRHSKKSDSSDRTVVEGANARMTGDTVDSVGESSHTASAYGGRYDRRDMVDA